MSSNVYAVESLYRPVYEVGAALAWGAAAVVTVSTSALAKIPSLAAIVMTTLALFFFLQRGYQSYRIYRGKLALAGNGMWQMAANDLVRLRQEHPSHLWLGRGFQWQAKHAQRAMELGSRELNAILPPKWIRRLLGAPIDLEEQRGEPWIHGLEPEEKNIFIPIKHTEGNTSIFGVTGAGKTRMYETIVSQMVLAGDVVICIDPKNDKDFRQALINACKLAGRPEAFIEFHPSFPSRSVALDLVKNFNRSTEVATRLADLFDADPGDTFVAFVWGVLAAITDGLLFIDERPSLTKLRRYVESGPEPLMEKVLQRFLPEALPDWQRLIPEIETQIRAKKITVKITNGTSRLQALAHMYHHLVKDEDKVNAVGGLLSVCEHPREHHAKMVQMVKPLLTKLTSESLEALLSPDYSALDGPDIFDSEKIIRGKHVFLMTTDSLSDATVSAALAGLFLADIRAVAGARYNHDEIPKQRIHIICDEAYEIVSPPLLSIMNKGRGAGLVTWLAAQTFSDYVVKFGSVDKARMTLGNTNNILALRVTDLVTQQYIVESIGQTQITQVSRSQSSGTRSEDAGLEFSGNISESVTRKTEDLFPAYLLGKLPDLHFIAATSGGKIRKGRLPFLQH